MWLKIERKEHLDSMITVANVLISSRHKVQPRMMQVLLVLQVFGHTKKVLTKGHFNSMTALDDT